MKKFAWRKIHLKMLPACWQTYCPRANDFSLDYYEDMVCIAPTGSGTIFHYIDVIMGLMVSQITNLTIVYSTVYSGADQRKHQSSASLAFLRGIHRRPVNSPHKRPVTRKMFPFDDIIMVIIIFLLWICIYYSICMAAGSTSGTIWVIIDHIVVIR